jgi:isopenicillin N synthase-like dioxygenase
MSTTTDEEIPVIDA